MGRRKIEIKAIKDDRNRSVTFLKRKGGLFKKAHELSVLCSVDVAVIIFGHNKKLYEFSSGDIHETIGRYQYYGGAHEHKGPEDYMGKRDMDDDDDDDENMGSPPPGSHSPPDHAIMPHHLQAQPAFQNMRHPTASPPMQNGIPYQHRGPSPQPQAISRPESRDRVRRPSSNLVPLQHKVSHAPPPAPPGSYAYIPNPPIYNPQAAAGMPIRGPPGPSQQHAPAFQYIHPPPQPPQPPHQVQQVFAHEQRRQSMPPTFHQQERPQNMRVPSPPQPQPQPQTQPQPQPEQNNFQSPPLPQPKPLPASKTASIFTPIDDNRSMLAQHWVNTSTADVPRTEATIKVETGPRSQSIDVGSINRSQVNGRSPQPPQPRMLPNGPAQPQRTASTPSVPIILPPSRTNSMQMDAKRPRLTVQIPSEPEDGGDATGGSSSKDTVAGPAGVTSPRGNAPGVVLPPPSPSASALLSAGATGPPNPFARPAPPVNTGSFGRSEMETPISALPSRFVSDQLLPSPSSFYPEWGFGRDSNMLPSPLTFQTPVMPNGPSFRDEDTDRKRKTSDGSDGGASKRVKT